MASLNRWILMAYSWTASPSLRAQDRIAISRKPEKFRLLSLEVVQPVCERVE